MSLCDKKAVEGMMRKLMAKSGDTQAFSKYTSFLKHFLTILEPKLSTQTHNLLHEESLEGNRVVQGLSDVFISWSAFASPAEFPHTVALLYSQYPHFRNEDDIVFIMSGEALTYPHDCERCCYPIPTYKDNPLLNVCPLCGGRVSLNGYLKRHGCYPSGLTHERDARIERIEHVNHRKDLWN